MPAETAPPTAATSIAQQGIGFWEAPPGNPGNTQAVEPTAGNWKTWVAAAKTMVPGPPSAYGSTEQVAEAREVYDISQHLTDEQKRIAKFWAGGSGTPLPPGIWNQLLLDKVKKVAAGVHRPGGDGTRGARRGPGRRRHLRLSHQVHLLVGPAHQRPYVISGSTRPGTPSCPTPVFPSYVSGHSTFSAAAAEVLAYLYPGEATRWRQMADEAGMSRLYGGLHYRADNLDGLKLGREVGSLVVQRARQDRADAHH